MSTSEYVMEYCDVKYRKYLKLTLAKCTISQNPLNPNNVTKYFLAALLLYCFVSILLVWNNRFLEVSGQL